VIAKETVMAIPAYMELYDHRGLRIDGSVMVEGRHGTVEVLSFFHGVRIPSDVHTGALTAVRKHEPVVITKPLDSSSPILFRACARGQTLGKVLVHWYEIDDGGREREYFRHILEGAKVVSMRSVIHDVKAEGKCHLNHVEQVALSYAKVTWLYVDGALSYSDSWDARVTAGTQG
jgi:type VI secretion system secreted protein Hcp